jgi:hypothetical protein
MSDAAAALLSVGLRDVLLGGLLLLEASSQSLRNPFSATHCAAPKFKLENIGKRSSYLKTLQGL